MLATRKVEAMLVHFNDDVVARPFPSSTNKLLLAYLDGREKRRSRRRAGAADGRGERSCCCRHRAYVLAASYLHMRGSLLPRPSNMQIALRKCRNIDNHETRPRRLLL